MNNDQECICVICGWREATTKDHVPPKCFFPKPRPSNLITVPARDVCNNGASDDDDEFKVQISLQLSHQHPNARALWK